MTDYERGYRAGIEARGAEHMTDLIAELRAVLAQTIQHYTKRPDDRCPFCAVEASAKRHGGDCRLDRVMRASALAAAPKEDE